MIWIILAFGANFISCWIRIRIWIRNTGSLGIQYQKSVSHNASAEASEHGMLNRSDFSISDLETSVPYCKPQKPGASDPDPHWSVPRVRIRIQLFAIYLGKSYKPQTNDKIWKNIFSLHTLFTVDFYSRFMC